MRVRVDHGADAVYVNLTDRPIKDSEEVADGIVVDYDFEGRIDPKWSYAPLSGNGAAMHGGRFNPKGIPTLYLSLSIDAALRESIVVVSPAKVRGGISVDRGDCAVISTSSTPFVRERPAPHADGAT